MTCSISIFILSFVNCVQCYHFFMCVSYWFSYFFFFSSYEFFIYGVSLFLSLMLQKFNFSSYLLVFLKINFNLVILNFYVAYLPFFFNYGFCIWCLEIPYIFIILKKLFLGFFSSFFSYLSIQDYLSKIILGCHLRHNLLNNSSIKWWLKMSHISQTKFCYICVSVFGISLLFHSSACLFSSHYRYFNN